MEKIDWCGYVGPFVVADFYDTTHRIDVRDANDDTVSNHYCRGASFAHTVCAALNALWEKEQSQ